VVDVVIVSLVWTLALTLVRHSQSRVTTGTPGRELTAHRLQALGVFSAASGLTFFVVWLLSDSTGPRWVHALAEPASLIAIAVAAVCSGCSAWVRAR